MFKRFSIIMMFIGIMAEINNIQLTFLLESNTGILDNVKVILFKLFVSYIRVFLSILLTDYCKC